MTLYHFRTLSELEKADAVWDSQFIAERIEGDLTMLLYNLGDFFVEVTYLYGNNEIIAFNPFKTVTFLGPYWEGVSLEDIEGLL